MEQIRILVYADDRDFSLHPVSFDGGLRDMERFTKEKLKDIAEVVFTFMQRHGRDQNGDEINAQNKLSLDLLKQHDEVWFFGLRQRNTQTQPHNELTKPETDALREWMQTGGVFLTGDHASPDLLTPLANFREKGSVKYFGLGKALCEKIPRAGQLRIWEGPPTAELEGELSERRNFNTQEGFEPCLLDDPLLQEDSIAQTLLLTRTLCYPHRLFWYEDENHDVTEIRKFPDHWHEGQVVVPKKLSRDWPEKGPAPVILARGQDKRFPNSEPRGVVAAYDGFDDPKSPKDSAGRIVADSSFHHYLDRNLKGLKSRNAAGMPIAGTDLDQIAHFYGNLAWWLAPKALRKKLKVEFLTRLAYHPDVLEVMGNSVELVGRTANAVVQRNLGRAKLKTFLGLSRFEQSDLVDEVFSVIFLGESSLPIAFQRPDFFVGGAIHLCHDAYGLEGSRFMFVQDQKFQAQMEQSLTTLVTGELQKFGEMLVSRLT